MELSKDVQYIKLKTTDVSSDREVETMIASGETEYMDGCNLRVSNHDPYTNEGLSSCNITATIELISIDPQTGAQTKII